MAHYSSLVGAPVTKVVLLGTVLCSILNMFTTARPSTLTLHDLSTRPSAFFSIIWRSMALHSSMELMFSSVLLYTFRVFERQWGSPRFAVYSCLSFVLSAFVHLALLVCCRSGLGTSPRAIEWRAGPYGVVFALFWRYVRDIPPVTPFSLFGVRMSDKVFLYGSALHLFLANSPGSMVAALSGMVGGAIASSDTLGLGRLNCPPKLRQLARSYLLPRIQSPNLYFVSRPMQANAAALNRQANAGLVAQTMMNNDLPQPNFIPQAQAAADGNANANDAGAGNNAGDAQFQGVGGMPGMVDPNSLQQLEALGFDRGTARGALIAANGSVELAAGILLGGD